MQPIRCNIHCTQYDTLSHTTSDSSIVFCKMQKHFAIMTVAVPTRQAATEHVGGNDNSWHKQKTVSYYYCNFYSWKVFCCLKEGQRIIKLLVLKCCFPLLKPIPTQLSIRSKHFTNELRTQSASPLESRKVCKADLVTQWKLETYQLWWKNWFSSP